MSTGSQPRLAILTNILSPYRLPLFEELARLTGATRVFLMSETEENRHWALPEFSFPVEVLPGFHWRPPGHDSSMHLNAGVSRALTRFAPDAVLSGGFSLANVLAARYCRARDVAYFGWGEVSLRDRTSRSRVRRWFRRHMTRAAAGAIASSSESRDAFISYGADPGDVLLSLLPIDVDGFRVQAEQSRTSPGLASLRKRYPGRILLSVSQLIPRKGCLEMLDIFSRVQAEVPDASLVFLGAGPELERLQAEVLARKLRHVFFEGFVQADELPRYFAVADLFVFHTLFDTYGVVLAEAMASGLLSCASVHASATRDLIENGTNGFTIDPRNARACADAILNALALEPSGRQAMVQAAYARIARCNFTETAEAMVQFMSARICRRST